MLDPNEASDAKFGGGPGSRYAVGGNEEGERLESMGSKPPRDEGSGSKPLLDGKAGSKLRAEDGETDGMPTGSVLEYCLLLGVTGPAAVDAVLSGIPVVM